MKFNEIKQLQTRSREESKSRHLGMNEMKRQIINYQ